MNAILKWTLSAKTSQLHNFSRYFQSFLFITNMSNPPVSNNYGFKRFFFFYYFLAFILICRFSCYFPAALSGRIGFPSRSVFVLQRSAVRRRNRGMASVLRRGEPLHPYVRGFQGQGRGNVAQGTRRDPVPAGIVGHVHRRCMPGEKN